MRRRGYTYDCRIPRREAKVFAPEEEKILVFLNDNDNKREIIGATHYLIYTNPSPSAIINNIRKYYISSIYPILDHPQSPLTFMTPLTLQNYPALSYTFS